MAPKKTLPAHLFPQAFAGVINTQCECGWEIVSIVPEENDRRLALILIHLIQCHDLVMPKIDYYAY